MSRKDHFPAPVIRQLRERVANVCSSPSCLKRTIGPKASTTGTVLVGEAAHICAASPGGPRYSDQMTSQQRKSADNGIWLCSVCADLIDKDADAYPVDLLQNWKKNAEERALREIGRRIPREEDNINALTVALGGFPQKLLPNAINNIHSASSRTLEAIDPRFNVKSSFNDGIPYFELKAKEPVTMDVTICDQSSVHALGLSRMIEHGDEVEIPGSAIIFSGSPLIENFVSESDTLIKMSPQGTNAVNKIWFISKAAKSLEFFEDVVGNLYFGKKSARFDGHCCDKMFHLTYNVNLDQLDVSNNSFSVDLRKWESIDIRVLPYFSKLHQFFCLISSEHYETHSSLEIQGEAGLKGYMNVAKDDDHVSNTLALLNYTKLARAIALRFNIFIPFTDHIAFNESEFLGLERLSRIADNLMQANKDTAKIGSTLKIIADRSTKNYEILREAAVRHMKCIEPGRTLNIFGVPVNLPPIETFIENAMISIVEPKQNYEDGETFEVSIDITENYRHSTVFKE